MRGLPLDRLGDSVCLHTSGHQRQTLIRSVLVVGMCALCAFGAVGRSLILSLETASQPGCSTSSPSSSIFTVSLTTRRPSRMASKLMPKSWRLMLPSAE
jgi:hypothetical protein